MTIYKEVEVSCGRNNLPFVSKLDLDYQNWNRIEEIYRKVRGGYGYLDIYKGFWKEEYSYDLNGNITQKKNGWGEINYQYNQANQLQQAGNRKYQYDPNGNTIQEVLGKYKVNYTYNYENRLIKAKSQFKHHFSHWPVEGEVSYGYDASGRMVKRELNPIHGPQNVTETEYYIYNGLGLDILADYKYQTRQYGRYGQRRELEGVNEYYYGNGLLLASKRIDGQGRGHWGWDRDPLKDVIFYHQDALGSVVMLTDKNGQVEERYEYDIWGKAYDGKFEDGFPGEGHLNNVYGFTGQRYQPELEVYSFPYRDYNPRSMRWLTEDPIKDGMNWYQYCYGDPINNIDPLGLDIWSDISNTAKSAVNTITETAQQVSSTVSSAINSAVKSVTQTAKQAGETISNAVNNAVPQIVAFHDSLSQNLPSIIHAPFSLPDNVNSVPVSLSLTQQVGLTTVTEGYNVTNNQFFANSEINVGGLLGGSFDTTFGTGNVEATIGLNAHLSVGALFNVNFNNGEAEFGGLAFHLGYDASPVPWSVSFDPSSLTQQQGSCP